MANRNSPQFNRHRLEDGELETAAEQFLHLDEEEETETEEEEDDETANDYEDETEEEEEEEEEELITVAESPPRVSSSVQLRVGDGEKRRRDEKGGEACSLSGIESGDCSQGSDWDRSDIEGLFCPICMDAWTNNGSHHIWSALSKSSILSLYLNVKDELAIISKIYFLCATELVNKI